MILFYTVLYVNGLPVDYNVGFENDQFFFDPVFNPHDDIVAPFFTADELEEGRLFFHLQDEALREQAREDLEQYLSENNRKIA
jgi:hypothetical protein